ncbi:hypothetical protein EVAR_41362_1 [Eumeta japonica]|uniref:Uncharacterized protein n=1 Tax=Eumeta variegata TaxID=151549 RepID=A0A4C1XRY4_EUMVA|nr:hypothetical protein EVAR_41362_1 [Eumeta japonica]
MSSTCREKPRAGVSNNHIRGQNRGQRRTSRSWDFNGEMEPSSLNAGARSDLSHSGSVCRLYRPDSYSLGLHSQLRTPTIYSHTPSLAEVVNHVEPSVADVDITSVTEVVSSARLTGASVKNWGPLYLNTIKQKWSTSLRSRHIVDLALSESDQSLRSPGPAQIPSPAIPDRSSAQPSPSSSTSSPQFKRPKTVNRRIRRRLIPNGVSTNVEECTSGTKKLLMELGIKPRCAIWLLIQPASTHQVITFPDVHVSADEDMPSSSRTFRVSSPTEALLDPESGSSYDDSEFSDDDDAEYLVTSAKRRFSRIYQTMRSYHLSPALARYLKCRGFDCLGTERLTRKNIPEDVKEMKKTVKGHDHCLPLRRCNGVGRMQKSYR